MTSRTEAARVIRRLHEMARRGEFVPVDDRVGPPGAVVVTDQ